MQRQLGKLGPAASAIGLGTFGFASAYGPADSAEAHTTITLALDRGCNLLDTADSYGGGESETWVGNAIRGRRQEVVLCTKVGFEWDGAGHVLGRCGTAQHIHQAVDASLKRLATDFIDVYTLHRVDPLVPIEETFGAMAELVAMGKVRWLGLSEVDRDQLVRAHAVHPITAVQSEYSLWTRDPEREILPLCRELRIAFVAFSPLGRGMFSDSLQSCPPGETDFRRNLPRFASRNLQQNLDLSRELAGFAERKGCTSSQVALAWILKQGEFLFAIPGTRRPQHLMENLDAANVELRHDELEELERIFYRRGSQARGTAKIRPSGLEVLPGPSFGRGVLYQLPRSPKTSMTWPRRSAPFSQLRCSPASTRSPLPAERAWMMAACSSTEVCRSLMMELA